MIILPTYIYIQLPLPKIYFIFSRKYFNIKIYKNHSNIYTTPYFRAHATSIHRRNHRGLPPTPPPPRRRAPPRAAPMRRVHQPSWGRHEAERGGAASPPPPRAPPALVPRQREPEARRQALGKDPGSDTRVQSRGRHFLPDILRLVFLPGRAELDHGEPEEARPDLLRREAIGAPGQRRLLSARRGDREVPFGFGGSQVYGGTYVRHR